MMTRSDSLPALPSGAQSFLGALRKSAWLFAMAGLLQAGAVADGATLTWDTVAGDGGVITGGTGTWTDGLGNWNTGSGDATWNSSTPDAAIFGGTAGSVTLGSAVTVGNMVFNSAYNVFGGGKTLTLSNSTITANSSISINAAISGSTGLTKDGTGSLMLGGTNTYTGTTTISAGTLSTGPSGTLGSGDIVNNGTLVLGASTGPTLSQTISGTGKVTITAGSVTFSGTNTYTGVTAVGGGNLLVSNIGDGGVAGNLGAASNAASNIVLTGNAGLNYVGTGAVTNTDRLFSVGVTGGVLASQGTGAINFTNTGAMGFNSFSGARSLTLTGTNTGNNSLAAAIGDNGGATALIKSGAGKWLLTGTNSYSGTTTISAGVLQIGNGGTTGTLGTGGVTNNASLVINRSDAVTVGNVISGTGTLTQAGTGTTILTGANTYTGATFITAGVLQIGDGGTTGSLGTGTVNDNATLSFNRSDNITVSNSINGSGGVLQMGTGTTTLSTVNSYLGVTTVTGGTLSISVFNSGGTSSNIGAASNAATNIVLNGGTLRYTGGSISTDRLFSVGTSGGAVDASGSGVLTLSNTGSMGFNSQSGARTLTLTGTNTGSNTLAAVIGDNGGATGLTKSGSGSWTLTGSNSYTGATTINGGVLNVTSLANGGTNSNIGASSNAASNLVLNGGTLKYSPGAAGAVSTDRLFSVGTDGGTIDASGGYNIIFSNTGAMGFNGQSGARTLTLTGNNTNDNTIAAVIGDNGGATSVTKTGGGIWVLTGASTYTGVTTVSGTAVLKINSLANGGSASSIGAASSDASNLVLNGGTLTYTGGTASTDRLFSLGTSGIILNMFGTGGVTFTNTGAMGFNGQTGARTLTLANSMGGTSTIAAVIGDNGGATAVMRINTGTWALTGANTYTGATTINGGVLSVNTLADGGSASSIGAATNAASNLVLNGGTLQYTGSGSSTDRLFSVGTSGGTLDASGTGAVNFTNTGAMGFNSQTGTRTLTLTGTNTGTNTLAAAIGDNSGATSVTKTGAGTWALTGTNTYTGATTISAGVLQVGNGGASGTLGTGSVTDNAGLTFNRSDSITVSNAISGTGTLTQAGTGTTILTGSNSYSGTTTISGGTLQIGNGGTTGSLGSGSITNNGTLIINRSNAITISGVMSGTGALIQNGTGTTTLSGLSNSWGSATVNAGILSAGVASGLGNASAMIVNSGGTLATNGNPVGAAVGSLSGSGIVQNGSNNNSGLIISGNMSTTFSGVLQNGGTGTLFLTKMGAATTLTLSGGSSTYTGVTTITGGTLSVSTLADGGSASSIGASSSAATSLVLNGGTLKYSVGAGAAVSTDRLFSVGTSGGTIDASGGFNINFTSTGSMGFNSQSGARTLTLTGSNANDNTLAAVIGDNGGATAVTKSGTGVWVLSGANTYTGVTTLNGTGALKVSSLANGGSASSIGASSNAASNLVLNGGTFVYTGGAVSTDRLFSVGTSGATVSVVGSGGVTFTNTGSLGFNGQSGARTLTLANASAGTSTLAAVIGDNGGPTSLTRINAGIWALTGANTYTGATTINGSIGTILNVTSLANGGAASNIGAATNAASNLVLNGGTLQYTGAGSSTDRLFSLGTNGISLDASGTGDLNFTNTGSIGFNNQTGARTLTLIGSSLGFNTIAALIGDNGGATSVTKLGSGKWVLTGNNTYSGTTTISGGVLQIGHNTASGSVGTGNIVDNGILVLYRSDAFTLSNVISGTGTVSNAQGMSTLSGLNTYTGFTDIAAGTLITDTLANGGSASSIGASTSVAANLKINGGTLKYIGAGASTDRLFFVGVTASIDSSGTGALNFTNTGAMGLFFTTARTLTLTGTNTDNNTLAALISENAGATALVKSGAGTWVLSGANTYTGKTTVTGGVLSISSLGNGGSASNIGAGTSAATSLVLNGGALQYTGAAASTDRLFSVGTSGGTLDASGTGALNFTNTGSMGFNSQSGARTLTLTGANTGSNTLAAVIGDNGGATALAKSGGGTWVLTGANTYSGTTTINGGVLQVGNGSTSGTLGSGGVTNNASLVVNRSDAVTLSNTISGSGSFTQAGAGTTTLSGSNSYTGATTITSGVLNVTSLANGGSSSNIGASSNAAANLVLNGGTLQYTGSTNVSTDRLFSVGIGGGVIDVSGTGTVNFTNTGSMGFNGQSGERTLVLTGTNTTGINIIAAAIGDFGGATSVTIDGDAKWQLTGANTYTGATTLSSGVLKMGGSNLASAIIVGSHAILELNGLDTKIGSLAGSGTVQNNSSTAATLTTSGNDTSTHFSGIIQDGGAGALSLVKLGTGTFTLSGGNTYTGTTTISAGELQIGSGGTTGTLGTGAVTNNASLTINRSDAITLANNISGSGNFTQAGMGTTTLTGDSSYSGSTTINSGVLSVAVLADGGVNSNLGASSNAAGNLVLNGGALQYTGGATSTDRLFSIGSNGGTLDASGTGAVKFGNTGSLDFNGQSGIRTLTLTGSNTDGNTLAAVIGDNGGATALTKSGTGSWVLTATNGYTGATTISGGTLQIGDGGTTGSLSASSVLNNNGTLAFNRSDALTQGTDFASVISGSGGVTQAGSGTLTLNGDNTYTGGTNIKSGTLEVTGNNALGTADAGTTVGSGGTLLLNNVSYSTAEALKLNGSGAAGGGALRNSGTSSYAGQITAETNASINAGGGVLNLSGGLVKDGTVLTITGGGVVNVSGTGISGASANSDLVVDGTTMVVSADSDYNGPTTVQNQAAFVANAAVTTTRFDLSRDSTLSGTGGITTGVDQSIFINGTLTAGDPAVAPTATVFSLTTSGTGAVVMGTDSMIRLDLFSGAGQGSNLSNAAAADSVNLHGKIDATAGGTVVVGNPNGMTGFHGGDQWQLFQLNSADANAGGFIGDLALNDSSLHLASGFAGHLDQSTGVFSIIDTNGGLELAAVEGQALVSGGNTVTSDLNGHLFNLRSGGGEEGSGSIAASLDEGVIVGEGDGDPSKKDSPIAKRVPRSRQWEVFATVNYGNVKLNPMRTQSGVQVDSWASGAGIERHFTKGLTVGFAASFLQSTQGYTGNTGSLYLEGPALSAYVSYVRGGFWNSLLYSFGTYQMDTTRNPGAPFPTAYGSTRTYTHSVQYNTGWNFRFQNNTLVTGPFVGVDYLHGSVDAYSETGGGLAALRYSAQSYQSLVSRVGWSASKQIKTRFATVTPQVRLSYERQNIRSNNGTSVSLINVPFTSVGGGQTPGQDYLVAGLGVSLAFTDRFSLMLSYQGQFFRHDLQAHFGSVRFSYQF
ncbi:autotransporter-associated beta strand repeat-containing protein [Prosthecobacter sp.]|uniref:autotransporter-associated beta strand repeat-containing protein n=1 Tax=Prosthecobacter sp. TaxID=1965333 RepID=UPI0037841F20